MKTFVELRWPIIGDLLPSDHNYRLYSALIGKIPLLKNLDWQLGTITGISDKRGWIKLSSQSLLSVRCELAILSLFCSLDHQILRVGHNKITLGASEGTSLQPHEQLCARIVTIKAREHCRIEAFAFGVALGKQLQILGIESPPVLGDRKVLRIKGDTVVGFGLSFTGLKPEESINLQAHGLGGRRKLGAGVFFCFPATTG